MRRELFPLWDIELAVLTDHAFQESNKQFLIGELGFEVRFDVRNRQLVNGPFFVPAASHVAVGPELLVLVPNNGMKFVDFLFTAMG